MQKKCAVMLTYPLGVVIVDDELTWGHVRQTVLLQGKVPGEWCGSFRGRLLLISRSFRFLARLKTFSGGLLRWLDIVFQSQYLPSLSVNYVAINKNLEKLTPQLY